MAFERRYLTDIEAMHCAIETFTSDPLAIPHSAMTPHEEPAVEIVQLLQIGRSPEMDLPTERSIDWRRHLHLR